MQLNFLAVTDEFINYHYQNFDKSFGIFRLKIYQSLRDQTCAI